MRLLEGKTRGGQSGNLEAAAFLHRSAAEFGPDVIHRAFDFSAPRGAALQAWDLIPLGLLLGATDHCKNRQSDRLP